MLDTNIVVDILSKREGCKESIQLLKVVNWVFYGFISVLTVTDVMYILRKHISRNLVREAVQTLLLIVDVASILPVDIASAF